MGIENREYMQDEPTFGFGRPRSGRSMVVTLIIINVVVFFAQVATQRTISFEQFYDLVSDAQPAGAALYSEAELRREYERAAARGALPKQSLVETWFALDGEKVLYGQIWRLTTYDFLHDTGTIWHLLFNMWLLYLAGRRVETHYGSNEFLAFYLLAGVISGVVFMGWGWLTGIPGIAIGASGAAVSVMIVYALHWPNERWYIWGIIPVPVIVLATIGAALDLWPMLQQLQQRGVGDGVAHSAHVGGMIFGFLYVKNRWRILGAGGGRSQFRSRSSMGNWKRLFRQRPKLKVHRPLSEERTAETVPADVEARLDQLLEKITSQGEASLNDEERHFLADASRRYRNRT